MKRFWRVTAKGEKAAELTLYGDIGDLKFADMDVYPVSALRIAEEIKALGNVNRIDVRINSYGGEVFSAQAIYSMLKSHKAEVTVYVDGIAASAASLIAMAGDQIIMPENAIMMIHNPSSGVWGTSAEMRNAADVLDKVRQAMIPAYARTGKSNDELEALLDAETWMTGTEAVEMGFADKAEAPVTIAASIAGEKLIVSASGKTIEMEAARYRNVPGFFVPAAAGIPQIVETEDENMNMEELKSKHPDLVQAIRDEATTEATTAERQRIKDIEEFGAVAATEEGFKAKFDDPCGPGEFAARVLKSQARQGEQHLEKIRDDAHKMPVVSSAAPGNDDEDKRQLEASIRAGYERR